MAFNIVLLCCIQKVNHNVRLDLGGGWKYLVVPWHAPPLPHGPSGLLSLWQSHASASLLRKLGHAVGDGISEGGCSNDIFRNYNSGLLSPCQSKMQLCEKKGWVFVFKNGLVKILRLVCCSYAVDV